MKQFIPPFTNLYEFLKGQAESDMLSPCLSSHEKDGIKIADYSRGDFLSLVKKMTTYFSDKGIKKGDRVALNYKNSLEVLVISYSAWSQGIVTVPLDTKRDTPDDMSYKLKLTGARFMFLEHELPDDYQNAINVDSEVFCLETLQNISEADESKFIEGLEHEALILFTSGTTGRPKGASLSLKNLVANADGIKEWFSIKASDTFMVILPLHHINSTSFCFATLLSGARIAVLPGYSASQFWNQLANTGATFTSIVPTICYDQINTKVLYEKVKSDLKISRIQIGSAPVKPSDVEAFIDAYGINLYQGYGQTETALRVAGQPHDVSADMYKKCIQENSIGTEMKWSELEVLAPDGSPMKEGEEGELAVKGAVVMKGYIGGEKAFNDDGYFMTGDLAYYKEIDGRRFFYLKGRIKEIIIKGGVNISPAAVEDKLKKLHSKIDKVCVIGVPDNRYGEEVGACIVWKDDSQKTLYEMQLKKILESCQQELSKYETPFYLASIKEEEIPMTSTRKVQRSVLGSTFDTSRFISMNEVVRNEEYRFEVLDSFNQNDTSRVFEILNQCFAPLTIDEPTFKQYAKNGTTIIAKRGDEILGSVTLIRTNKTADDLTKETYSSLTADLSLSTNEKNGTNAVCIAIGNAAFNPSPVSKQEVEVPSEEAVAQYLENDPVFKFHSKVKGELETGAKLIKLLKNSRPEDERSLGYNMLMRYPEPPKLQDRVIVPNSSRSIGVQLIEAVLSYAQQNQINEIFAYSRPSGLKDHITK